MEGVEGLLQGQWDNFLRAQIEQAETTLWCQERWFAKRTSIVAELGSCETLVGRRSLSHAPSAAPEQVADKQTLWWTVISSRLGALCILDSLPNLPLGHCYHRGGRNDFYHCCFVFLKDELPGQSTWLEMLGAGAVCLGGWFDKHRQVRHLWSVQTMKG